MPTTIKHKIGSGAPLASDLVEGELGLDTVNGRAYTENSVGSIVELGVNPAGEIQANAGIALPDSQKATFGASDDLQIYHDGTNSYITDGGTGDLNILGSNLNLKSGSGAVTYASGSSATGAFTLYKGTAKLTTTDAGIDVTGDVSIGDGSASATRLLMGTGDDSKMFHNGTDTYWINDTGNIIIRNQSDDKDILLQTDDGAGGTTTYITVDGSETDVSLHYGGSEKLTTTSTGVDVTGTVTADGLTVDGNATVRDTFKVLRGSGHETTYLHIDVADVQTTFNGQDPDGYMNYKFNSNDTTRMLIAGNSGDISFYEDTGTTAKFFWDASAESLGIGTITPDAPLDVVAPLTNSVYASFSSTDTRPLQLSSFDTTSVDAGHDFNATSGNGALSFSIGGTERARITSSGNVGIGTSSPTAALQVYTATANNQLYLTSADTGQAQLSFGGTTDPDGGYIRYSDASDWMAFATQTTERMRIDSSGNVGIGTSSPSKSLQVASGVSSDIARFENNAGGYTFGYSTALASLDLGASDAIRIRAGSTERMRIDSSGNLLVNRTTTLNSGTLSIQADDGYQAITAKCDNDGNSLIQGFNTSLQVAFQVTGSGTVQHRGTLYPVSGVNPDIGTSANQYGNLHLSGGVYLGGTGAANYLDDYETGTFTPVVSDAPTGGTTATYGSRVARYVKTGNQVTVYICFINISTAGMTATNTVYIQSLPFTSVNISLLNAVGTRSGNGITFSGEPLIGNNTTLLYTGIDNVSDVTSGTADLYITLTYETA